MGGHVVVPSNRVRIKGKFPSVFRFFLISVAYTILWVAVTSQLGFYSKIYGPQILLQLNLAYYLPSIPVLILAGQVEKLLDSAIGSTSSMLLRLMFGLLGCAALCAYFPFLPPHHYHLLWATVLVGSLSAVAFSTSYQLVSWFRSADTIALGIGCVGSGPLALTIQLALRMGAHPKPWQWISLFEISAGFTLAGTAAALSLFWQYWPILSGKVQDEATLPLLGSDLQDEDLANDVAAQGLLKTPRLLTCAEPLSMLPITPTAGLLDEATLALLHGSSGTCALRRVASAESDLSFADWRRRTADQPRTAGMARSKSLRTKASHAYPPYISPPTSRPHNYVATTGAVAAGEVPAGGVDDGGAMATLVSTIESDGASKLRHGEYGQQRGQDSDWSSCDGDSPQGVAESPQRGQSSPQRGRQRSPQRVAGSPQRGGGSPQRGYGIAARSPGDRRSRMRSPPPPLLTVFRNGSPDQGSADEADRSPHAADSPRPPSDRPPPQPQQTQEDSTLVITWQIFKDTWPVVISALVGSTLLNLIFPFFTYIPSAGLLGDNLPQALFYTRIFADTLGRMAPRRKALALTNPYILISIAGVLSVMSAGFFVYIKMPGDVMRDPITVALVASLWIAGGFINTNSYILAPSMVKPRWCTKAAAIIALTYQIAHIIGLFAAVILATVLYGDITGGVA